MRLAVESSAEIILMRDQINTSFYSLYRMALRWRIRLGERVFNYYMRRRKDRLRGADLSFLAMRRVDLSEADLSDVNLMHSDLSNADLRACNLTGADFSSARLHDTDLRNTILTDATISAKQLRQAKSLEGAILPDGTLFGSQPTHAALLVEDENALVAPDRRPSMVFRDLSGVDWSGANLVEALMQGATLIDANLSGADLRGANLRASVLDGANLADADLRGAFLLNATLHNCDLSGCNLQGALVLDTQLAQARTLDNVILPDGSRYRSARR